MRSYHRAIRRAVIETLEDRQLLSSISLVNSILTIQGDTNTVNDLSVQLNSSSTSLLAVANGKVQSYAPAAVKSIHIIGGDQADRLTVSTQLRLPALIEGGGGNDWIRGGSGSDPLYGGTGDDTLNGDNGDDKLYGGPGIDSIYSSPGNDSYMQEGPISSTNSGTTGGTTGGTTVPTSSITPVIQFLSTAGIAGQAIHVNGLRSNLGSNTLLNVRLQWDFGNAAGAHNQLTGFNAAHVYNTQGIYTITLKISDATGRYATTTAQVNVAAANRTVYYVSASGSDANDGRSAQSAFATLARAKTVVGNNTEILFRRGDKFNAAAMIQITGQNVLIGDYGDASTAAPVIYWTGAINNGTVFGLSTTAANVTIEGLTFDSIYPAVNGIANKGYTPYAVGADGTNVTVRDCTFRNVMYAVNANGAPAGLLVQDNTAPLDTGIRGYFVWLQGTDSVIIGNTVANVTREHVIRGYNVQRTLIAGNTLANLNRSTIDAGDTAKATIALGAGQHFYVADNTVTSGGIGFGPLGGTVGWGEVTGGSKTAVQKQAEASVWVMVVNNRLNNTQLEIKPAVHHLMAQNNLGKGEFVYAQFKVTCAETLPLTWVISDINILNNTFVSTSRSSNFIWSRGHTVNAITLKNNVFIAPNLLTGAYEGAPVRVDDADLGSFAEISHNVWPIPAQIMSFVQGGINFVRMTTSDSAANYQSPTEWDAFGNVHGDVYQVTSLTMGNQVTLADGTVAGSVLV